MIMKSWQGSDKPKLSELPSMKDRLTFIYLESCRISRQECALKAEDKTGYVLIPSHALLVILCGPGTTVTHRAIELIADSGTVVMWVGEGNTKFYGMGRSLSGGTYLLQLQAKYVSSPRLHMEVVKRMYSLRYPGEDLTSLTLQQLRGKEGARVRKEYAQQAKKWNVPWSKRDYEPDDFSKGDPVNRALSVANNCLYALVLSVINGLGLSPGLGFIHVGHEKSFVYDIADLYKADITIPLAFRLASISSDSIETRVRKELREVFRSNRLIERMIQDLKFIFDIKEEEAEEIIPLETPLCLWDNYRTAKSSGISYQSEEELANRSSEKGECSKC